MTCLRCIQSCIFATLFGLATLWAGTVGAGEGDVVHPSPDPAQDDSFSVHQWADRIDTLVDRAAAKKGIEVSAKVTDAKYLRRISLDLLGRIPTLDEAATFHASPDRQRRVREFLDDDAFADFWAECWTTIAVGEAVSRRTDRVCLQNWFRERIAQDTPWNRTVADLIAAQGQGAFDGPSNFVLHHAEDPVVPIGRVFLGVQLDCARCHDHPSARWTQDHYQDMKRFFDPVSIRNRGDRDYTLVDRTIRDGDVPCFLTGIKPRTRQWRRELSVFVTASKPFARTMAHRVWYHFFGQGIATNPDQTSVAAKGEHAELIQTLADAFVAGGYRLRPLIQTICATRAYARQVRMVPSGAPDASNHDPPHASTHAHSRVVTRRLVTWTLQPCAKGLTPSQWRRSAEILIGQAFAGGVKPDAEVRVDRFPLGNLWERTPTLEARLRSMALPLPRPAHSSVDLFRLAYSRPPTQSQREWLESVPPRDLLFALLHSNEFCFWH
ncbi:MAG: DUF1549 domain-containing protein [Planctomycetota bacterium]